MDFNDLYINRMLEREYPAVPQEPVLLAEAPAQTMTDAGAAGYGVSPMFGKQANRPKIGEGSAEAVMTVGSAIAGSLPAGLGGIAQLIATQDPAKAASAIEDLMQAFTYIPRTPEGQKQAEALAQSLQLLGIPAEWVGDKVLEMTGSPLAATAANVALDPLNLVMSPAIGKVAKSAARSAKRAFTPGQ